MKKYNMITPEGTKDILFEECIQKRKIQQKAAEIFTARGYNEVITPGIEYYDVFDLENAGIPQYEMYKTSDNKGRLVVFRPDLTLPIARLTATKLQNAKPPIRLFYNQNIYRNRKDMSGRSDETAQAGVELIGAKGLKADIEVISMAVTLLSSCVDNFRIEIGHAAVFKLLADKLPVSEDIKEEIRSVIESKNYAALGEILDELEPSSYVTALKRLPRLFGGEETFEEAAKYMPDDDVKEVLDYLEKLYNSLRKLGLGDRIMVDLGLVQRNDYYTGVVFSAYAYGHGDALLQGGRYDNLLQEFNAPMPAVGFGLDVDAMTSIMMADIKPLIRVPEILVHADEDYEVEAQIKLNDLISQGYKAESSVFDTREEAEAYAKEKGIRQVVYVGKDSEGVIRI
ncbi:MAG: ATP phosphoribosyltransferase regulatory subunit [Clostridia bacterium]|nr:ATP phosphoribosyltransferase regulatory subunit [Clostridia bacterium]